MMMFKKYQQLQSSRIDIDFFNLVESSKNTNNYNPQELRCWKNTPKKVQKIPTITILKNISVSLTHLLIVQKIPTITILKNDKIISYCHFMFKKYQQLQSSRISKPQLLLLLGSKNTNNYNPQE